MKGVDDYVDDCREVGNAEGPQASVPSRGKTPAMGLGVRSELLPVCSGSNLGPPPFHNNSSSSRPLRAAQTLNSCCIP